MTGIQDIQDSESGDVGIPPLPPLAPVLPPAADTGSSSIGPSSATASSSATLSLSAPMIAYGLTKVGENINQTYVNAVNGVLDTWAKNIEEINEQAKRIQESFLAQNQALLAMRGDPLTGVVSGALSPTAASAASSSSNPGAANLSPVLLMSTLERLRDWEKNARFSTTTGSTDNALQTAAIPALSILTIGSVLAIVASQLSSAASNVNMIPDLAPVISSSTQTMVTGSDVVLQVNLMVTSLLYPTTLIGVMRSFQKKGLNPNQAAAEEFAQTVIGLAGNPDALSKLVGGKNITPYLIPLASYAMSLLYAVEVGKAPDNYMGMEPEEFRDLLNGTLVLNPNGADLTALQKLQLTLAGVIRYQLSLLSADQREKILHSVLDYLSESHSVSGMTNLVDILSGVFGHSGVGHLQAA